MMATGVNAVHVASPATATGGVTRAPIGSALPTDATTALDVAFEKLGFVSEDGVTKTVDASDDKIKAWGGDTVRVVRSDHSVSYTLTFMESGNPVLLKAIYGEDNVIVTGSKIEVRTTSQMPVRAAFTLEMLDGETAIREVIPNGQLTQSGDVPFVHSGVIQYEVTIEALPNDAGVKSYSYIEDTAA